MSPEEIEMLVKNELLPVLHPSISVHYKEKKKNGAYHVYSSAEGNGSFPQPQQVAVVPVDVLLPLIDEKIIFQIPLNGRIYPCVLGGEWDSERSNRLMIFKKSTSCVECGTKAKEWRVTLQNDDCMHLDLVAENGLILTRDHIVPRSKYRFVFGSNKRLDSMRNSQVLCEFCNNDKANKLPDGVQCWFDESTIGEDNWII